MVSLSSFFYLLLLQQIFQVIIARDALQFLLHNLLHLFLDTPVVRLHRFFHAVVAVLVREIGNDRNFLVGTFLPLHLLGIHHNLAVKNFLFDTFVEVVGHRTDKHSLRQSGNLARRDKRVHLRVDGCRNVLPVDRDRLPFLQHLSEPLRKRLGGFAHHLTGEDISDSIHHDFGFFIAIVTHQLAEILKSQTYGNLVASCGGDKVVQPLEIYRRKLVDDN